MLSAEVLEGIKMQGCYLAEAVGGGEGVIETGIICSRSYGGYKE